MTEEQKEFYRKVTSEFASHDFDVTAYCHGHIAKVLEACWADRERAVGALKAIEYVGRGFIHLGAIDCLQKMGEFPP